jgi:predicted CXXCH cytochrome family protein
VREVVFGQEAVTCLNCHDVHGRSSKKHHRVPRSDYCLHCHSAEAPQRDLEALSVSSKTCGY